MKTTTISPTVFAKKGNMELNKDKKELEKKWEKKKKAEELCEKKRQEYLAARKESDKEREEYNALADRHYKALKRWASETEEIKK